MHAHKPLSSPADEQDMIVEIYKAGPASSRSLLFGKELEVLSTKQKKALIAEWLLKFELLIQGYEKFKHPAAKPARDLYNIIKTQTLPHDTTLTILNTSYALMRTPPSNESFTQHANDLLLATNDVRARRRSSIIGGIACVLVAALSIGALVALTVLTVGVNLLPAAMLGIAGFLGVEALAVGGWFGTSFFKRANKLRDAADNMDALQKAVSQAPKISN